MTDDTYPIPEAIDLMSKIVDARHALGLSQRDIAARLTLHGYPCTRSTYAAYECMARGRRPSRTVAALSQAFIDAASKALDDLPITDICPPDVYARLRKRPHRYGASHSKPLDLYPTRTPDPLPVRPVAGSTELRDRCSQEIRNGKGDQDLETYVLATTITAYRLKAGMTYATLADALTDAGYLISAKAMEAIETHRTRDVPWRFVMSTIQILGIPRDVVLPMIGETA